MNDSGCQSFPTRALAVTSLVAACLVAGALPLLASDTLGVGNPDKSDITLASTVCPLGEFAIGVHYRGGWYLNAVQLRCGTISQGAVVFTRDAEWAGASGGDKGSFANCAPGKVVVGISAMGGTYVDAIRNYQCATVNTSTRAVSASVSNTGSFVGGTGGARTDLRCPANKALRMVSVKRGSWIDYMVGTDCRTLTSDPQ